MLSHSTKGLALSERLVFHKMQLIDLGHSMLAKPAMVHLVKLIKERLEVEVEFFADCYGCNYYTNFHYNQPQESEDFLALFTHR